MISDILGILRDATLPAGQEEGLLPIASHVAADVRDNATMGVHCECCAWDSTGMLITGRSYFATRFRRLAIGRSSCVKRIRHSRVHVLPRHQTMDPALGKDGPSWLCCRAMVSWIFRPLGLAQSIYQPIPDASS